MPKSLGRALALIVTGACTAAAQMPDDGFLMPKKALAVGVVYAHDSWSEYWEGTLKRSNENIGTLTAQSAMIGAHYGVTDRVTLAAMLPYVWTHATEGVLHDMRGFQDLTVAAKYRLLATPVAEQGTLNVAIVGAAVLPVSDYSPDFLPLSIGSASRRFTGRVNLHFQSKDALFVTGSAGHTWRNKVRLDRDAYFTDGQLYLTGEVAMPRIFDYVVSVGYQKGRLTLPVTFAEQRTLGGGDIRRQDMPFVSNRMNFRRIEANAMYAPRVPKVPTVRFGVGHTLSGRNVGQSTTITTGFMYTFDL